MNPATAQLLITAVIQSLDLIERVANKQFDSREELDAYIEERNEVRRSLVDVASKLAHEDESSRTPEQWIEISNADAEADTPQA